MTSQITQKENHSNKKFHVNGTFVKNLLLRILLLSSKYLSASSAAIHPVPAAVIA
jgi:hypothetical protein